MDTKARGEKILEVGSGRGSVLFGLLELNPKLQLTGLELSEEGILRSNEKQKELGSTIAFVEGDAKRLPFEDNSFDVVFTRQVLESMPNDYSIAVAEMKRVAKHGIFVEEFREAQSIADLAWLRFKDRFRYSYKCLNMKTIFFSGNVPHKDKYSLGLYVGEFE